MCRGMQRAIAVGKKDAANAAKAGATLETRVLRVAKCACAGNKPGG